MTYSHFIYLNRLQTLQITGYSYFFFLGLNGLYVFDFKSVQSNSINSKPRPSSTLLKHGGFSNFKFYINHCFRAFAVCRTNNTDIWIIYQYEYYNNNATWPSRKKYPPRNEQLRRDSFRWIADRISCRPSRLAWNERPYTTLGRHWRVQGVGPEETWPIVFLFT